MTTSQATAPAYVQSKASQRTDANIYASLDTPLTDSILAFWLARARKASKRTQGNDYPREFWQYKGNTLRDLEIIIMNGDGYDRFTIASNGFRNSIKFAGKE